MHICHEEIVVADPRVAAAPFRSAMNVDIFAKDIVVADGEKCFFAFELEILRLQANRSEGIKLIILTDCGRTFDNDV